MCGVNRLPRDERAAAFFRSVPPPEAARACDRNPAVRGCRHRRARHNRRYRSRPSRLPPRPWRAYPRRDRKSVGEGKGVSERVELGGRGRSKKKKRKEIEVSPEAAE